MDYQIIIVAAIMMVLDVVFGFAEAVRQKDIQSEKLRNGLWHKAGFVGLIVLAYVIEYTAQYADLGFDVPTVLAVCIYVIVTEIVSVFENLCVLNPELVNSPMGAVFSRTPTAHPRAASSHGGLYRAGVM